MKTFAIIGIIFVILLLLVAGAFVVVAVVNNSKTEIVTNTYELENDFSDIDINLDTSNLEFKISSDDAKKVVCEETDKDVHKVEVKDGTLFVKQTNLRAWYEKILSLGSWNLKVTVYLPRSEFSKLNIENDTGNISIPSDYSFEEVQIDGHTGNVIFDSNVRGTFEIKVSTGNVFTSKTIAQNLVIIASTGKINIEDVNVEEDIKITVSTGNITTNNVKANNLTCKASTGNLTISNTLIGEKMTIQTSTGNVKFEMSDAQDINVKTSTGTVKGTLLSEKIFYAESSSGKVKVPHSFSGGKCEIETSSGNIEIELAN